MWWSPHGNKLAFLSSNETNVPIYSFPYYSGNPYTNDIELHYPKAGYSNPKVSLAVFDLLENRITWMDLDNFARMEYVTSVSWDDSSLIVTQLNRTQNLREILRFSNTENTTAQVLTTMTDPAYIEEFPIIFLPNTDYFVTIQQDSYGFNHIAKYSRTKGNFFGFITNGNWEVTQIVGCNSLGKIFYISTEISPLERHLFSITYDGLVTPQRITEKEGWYSATFDPWSDFYILNYEGPQVPFQSLFSSDNVFIIDIVNNKEFASKLSKYKLPEKKFLTIPTNNKDINAYMLFPPDFSNTKKYPVLINVYGGPNSQGVTKKFDQVGFHAYVASQLNFIVAAVDGRGTGGRGSAWRKQTYKRLGDLETEDQISAAKYFQSLDYVNASSVGIWGWSYGGFMTLMVLSAVNSPLRFGMAVAPVTNWRFYDSIYTERYMAMPIDNFNGYNQSSLLDRVANFKDESLLLVHGTGDDNVHFENTAELVKLLIEKDIQFQMMMYTNRDHLINQGGARPHLYRLLANYLKSKL